MRDYRYSYLKCTGCGDTFDFHINENTVMYTAHGSYKTAFSAERYYQSNNPLESEDAVHEPHLLLSPCWCLHCESASLIERIPDIDDYIKAAALRRFPKDTLDHQIHDRLLELDERDILLHYQWRLTRTAPPKCLCCGHSSYLPIDEGKRETGITHEACWNSPIHCHMSPICSSTFGWRTCCHYDLAGDLVLVDLVTRDEKNPKKAALFSALERNEFQPTLIKATYAVYLSQSHIAIDLLKPLADAAIPEAMCMLGAVYQAGVGIPTDAQLALRYLLLGVEAGNGVAAYNLFNLYHKGIQGIPANEESCFHYLGLARQMGMYHS